MNALSPLFRRALAGAAGRRFNSLIRDRAGAAAVTIAISFTGIAGLAGLGTEVANWYFTERSIQGATDAAAHTGATALMVSATSAAAKTEAKSVAANFGFSSGSGATVTVNNPPASGSHTGDNSAVEVIISQPMTLMLSGLFVSSAPTLQARSVALKPAQTNPPCVMTLDTNSETSMSTSGTPAINLTGCSVYVNSAGSAALNMGGGTLSATAAYIVGGETGPGLTMTNGTHTGADPKSDPYASVSMPSVPSNPSGSDCSTASKTINNYHLSGNKTDTFLKNVSGGTCVFHSGLQIDGGSTLNLCPGTYFVDSGTLSLQGGAILNAPPTANTTPVMSSTLCGTNTTGGVTIVLTNSLSANSVLNVTAPTSGPTSGIGLFQSRVACSGNNGTCGNTLNGGGTQNIQGAIYFPDNAVTYKGGASTGGAVCTQLIAYQVTFSGNSNLASSCASAGTASITVTSSQLVE
jgi:Flp pilus assembly protein TadG